MMLDAVDPPVTKIPECFEFFTSQSMTRTYFVPPSNLNPCKAVLVPSTIKPLMIRYLLCPSKIQKKALSFNGLIVTVSPGLAATVMGLFQDIPLGMDIWVDRIDSE